jgi:hypothetical protein
MMSSTASQLFHEMHNNYIRSFSIVQLIILTIMNLGLFQTINYQSQQINNDVFICNLAVLEVVHSTSLDFKPLFLKIGQSTQVYCSTTVQQKQLGDVILTKVIRIHA